MNDWRGVTYDRIPDNVSRDAIAEINDFLFQLSPAIGRISRGEQPDSSGDPLGGPLLDDFWKLSGRLGGQIGFGGTAASQNATIGSTAHGTKGFVYLGTTLPRVAFNETSCFFGVGTEAPAVRIHANTASAGTTTIGATGTEIYRGSYGGTTLFDILPIQFNGGVYDTAIKPNNGAVQIVSTDGTAGIRFAPTSSRAFIQTGILNASGTVLNDDMTLGGLGATIGNALAIAFDQVFFTASASYPQVGMGVGLDPASFSGTWRGVMAIRANSSSTPALSLFAGANSTAAPILEFNRSDLFGASLRRTMSVEHDETQTNPQSRLTVWNGASTPARTGWISSVPSVFGGGSYALTIFDRNSRRALGVDSGTLWADSVTATVISLGASVSSVEAVTLAGIDRAVLDRFSIQSLGTLITNQDVSAQTVPGALFHVRNTADAARVLERLQPHSSQSADIWQLRDATDAANIASFNNTGKLVLTLATALQITGGSVAAGNLLVSDASGNYTAATATSVVDTARTWSTLQKFPDDMFEVVGSANNAKIMRLEVDGLSEGTRTLTPQDASYIIAGTNLVQTFTRTQTFQPTSAEMAAIFKEVSGGFAKVIEVQDQSANVLLRVSNGGTTELIAYSGAFPLILADDAAGSDVTFDVSLAGAGVTVLIPTGGGAMVTGASSAVLTNKELATGCYLRMGTASTNTRFGVGSSTSNYMRLNLAAISGTPIWVGQNLSGAIPLIGDDTPAVASGSLGKVDLTGQGSSIGTTNLSNTPPAGLYEVEVYVACTAVSGAGTPTLDVTIGWTDVVGATTRNLTADPGATAFPLALSGATGRTQGRILCQVASGDITYATTVNGPAGSPQYAIYVRVVALT